MSTPGSPLSPALASLVREARVLVVGAGGIGSELLKNLVLAGFAQIEIVRRPALPSPHPPVAGFAVSLS